MVCELSYIAINSTDKKNNKAYKKDKKEDRMNKKFVNNKKKNGQARIIPNPHVEAQILHVTMCTSIEHACWCT